MHDTVFREYDIRGKVGTEFLCDTVYDVARAIAYYFVQRDKKIKRVAIGMDGRMHSPAIKKDLVAGLQESGLDVIFIGICPSPVLYFALHTLPVQAGIMITASHNPKDYNGLKICLGKESVWGGDIGIIKQLYHERRSIVSAALGAYQEHNLIDVYVQHLVTHFPHLHDMPLRAVIDCGNGAAGAVLPQLVQAMQWKQVQLLYEQVDGSYPNHEADPVVPENMRDVKAWLSSSSAEIGIGLDGDADRMAAMTKQGYLIPGDQMLALFAQSMVHEYPGMHVVFDIKSSSGLIELLESWGAVGHMAPSGHAIIKKEMQKHKALLGGELSCHFTFSDRYYGYDDGIYALMRLFELVIQSKKTLPELLAIFPQKINSPELRIPCALGDQQKIIKAVHTHFAAQPDVRLITIDGVRVIFQHGWGIIRASHTQPVICLRFEAQTMSDLHTIVDSFYEVLKEYHIDTTLLAHYRHNEGME